MSKYSFEQNYNSAAWWSEHRSAVQAFDWLTEFEHALASLENNPERFPLTREDDAFTLKTSTVGFRAWRQQDTSRRV